MVTRAPADKIAKWVCSTTTQDVRDVEIQTREESHNMEGFYIKLQDL